MITIKHHRATLTLNPENGQHAHDMLARIDKSKGLKGPKLPKPKGNPKHDSSKRHFPKFEPGMTTADYLREYAALNGHVHLLPAGFDHADRPAPMLDPSYPEVIAHED